LDFPNIKVLNIDLVCLIFGIKVNGDKLVVPVTHLVPAAIMGSGLGANQTNSGDYDIQLFDEKVVAQYGLKSLRLGDLVAIIDADHSLAGFIGRALFRWVWLCIRIVTAGHGPGVTTLMTSSDGKIVPQINQSANIASLLKLRADI
jgi:hypothetical protein